MQEQLLQKYNIAAPRYTSYPTVPYWQNTKPSESAWKERVLTAFGEDQHLNLYIHLPYCERLCTYCGCNKRITKNHKVEQPYIETVLKEWALYLKMLPTKPILKELHLGGGTPTFFSPENLRQLIRGILDSVIIPEAHNYSFEAHPFSTTYEHLAVLRSLGFNRLSVGVQDFDTNILKVINRFQTYEQIENVVSNARTLGYESINFDLIFGLPFQTKANILTNIAHLETLRPDRIAFYGYAHIPWLYPGQRAYSDDDIPKGKAKWELYELGKTLLLEMGYEGIGFDHFALPNEALRVAQLDGTLHRNFMGYTPHNTKLNIALGVSAISDSWTAFVQNEKKIEDYTKRVEAGEFPFFKGHLLSKTDQIIRHHILELICNYKTEWDTSDLRCDALYEALDRLDDLEKDGLVKRKPFQLSVTDQGKPFIRNICLAFDTYYWDKQPQRPVFSKVI